MGVAEWFNEFCANIQVKDPASILKRSKALARCLNMEFWETPSNTSHILYIGSYGRNTAISSFSDLDLIFQLPYLAYGEYDKYWGNGQEALLRGVCSSLKKIFPTANIGEKGQVIRIPFEDGITFRLLPAFINKDGSYRYADSDDDGRWMVMHPRLEIKAMRERNANCNNNLVSLCRMMRAWKDTWSIPMCDILIDTLAYQFIIGWEYKDKSHRYYDFMCRDFLKDMADQDENQAYWKAPGSGRRLYDKGLFRYKARRCYYIAADAIKFETDKKDWAARRKWRKIFGDAFPA